MGGGSHWWAQCCCVRNICSLFLETLLQQAEDYCCCNCNCWQKYCLHLLSCFYWETLHSVRLTFLNLLFTPSLPSTLSLSPSQYFTSVLVCSIFDERMIWQMLMKHSTRFSPVTLLHHPPPPHFLTVGQWGCSKCPSLATVINTDMTAELWYKMAPQL